MLRATGRAVKTESGIYEHFCVMESACVAEVGQKYFLLFSVFSIEWPSQG